MSRNTPDSPTSPSTHARVLTYSADFERPFYRCLCVYRDNSFSLPHRTGPVGPLASLSCSGETPKPVQASALVVQISKVAFPGLMPLDFALKPEIILPSKLLQDHLDDWANIGLPAPYKIPDDGKDDGSSKRN